MNKNTVIHWLKLYIALFGKIFSYIIPLLLATSIVTVIQILLSPSWLWVIAVVSLLFVMWIYKSITNLFVEYSVFTDTLLNVLNKEIEKYSDSLSERCGRVYPDRPEVNIKLYMKAILSIKSNGYIEFNECQNMGLDYQKRNQLFLYAVTPGMHQYFLILRTEGDYCDPVTKGYIRIGVPEGLGVDDRDFAETWFNHIFPILGNISNSISEKMAGSENSDYYIIKNFRIIPKGNKGMVSFRIYV